MFLKWGSVCKDRTGRRGAGGKVRAERGGEREVRREKADPRRDDP